MALITVSGLFLTFGGPPLFDGLGLTIESGQRLCLLGPNGTGKSTLLKVLSGVIEPDSGTIARQNGLVTHTMDQGFPDYGTQKITEVLGKEESLVLGSSKILDQIGVDPESRWSELSGGSRRKVMVAQTLAGQPDLILLDEPTNHLDLSTIEWLEDYCCREAKSLVFVTHDRAFARGVSNRIAYLDRGRLSTFECSYDEFLERRDKSLLEESIAWAKQDKVRAQEEEWLRRGVKARRTRDEGRVKALLKMREDHKSRRVAPGQMRTSLQTGTPSGSLVAELEDVEFTYPGSGEVVLKDLTFTVMKGDKIGIVGPNGSGKTTLVKLLVGELAPNAGKVRLGTNLSTLYYDQNRSDLDQKKSLLLNLSGGDDTLIVRGKSIHVNAYAQDFLFSPDRLPSPVFTLSGGEQNRLVLAKLFAEPGNLLVFDEPTNDLDTETLELLEDLLVEYEGTVLLVSHDREFVDNVVSDCLIILPDGRVHHHVGSFSEYRLRETSAPKTGSPGPIKKALPQTGATKTTRQMRLSFKEQKELEKLPKILEELEKKLSDLHLKLADPLVYAAGADLAKSLKKEVQVLDQELENAYLRWQELEEKFEETRAKTD